MTGCPPSPSRSAEGDAPPALLLHDDGEGDEMKKKKPRTRASSLSASLGVEYEAAAGAHCGSGSPLLLLGPLGVPVQRWRRGLGVPVLRWVENHDGH